MTYKKLLQDLKLKIKKDYGPRCGEFLINCCVCQKWLMLDILQDCVDLEGLTKIKNKVKLKSDAVDIGKFSDIIKKIK